MDQIGKSRAEKHAQVWLFTMMKSYQGRDEAPMVEACGPVQTAEGGEYYVGGALLAEHLCGTQGPSIIQQSDGNSGLAVRQGSHR